MQHNVVRRASGARKRKVPNVSRSNTAWRGPIIATEDIPELCAVAGFAKGLLMDAAVAAQLLDGCFKTAFDWGLMELVAPAPAKLRDWFKQVDAAAKSLAQKLDLDPEPLARCEIGPHTGPALNHLANALSIRDLPFRSFPMELESWLHGSKAFAAEFATQKRYWKPAFERCACHVPGSAAHSTRSTWGTDGSMQEGGPGRRPEKQGQGESQGCF
jgi:hypothetical protein